MIEPHEISAAKDIGVGARIARPAMWVAAALVSFIALAGLWASDVRAQSAAADQAAPKLTNETCLGCHGQEGFAPATTPGDGHFSDGAERPLPGQRARKAAVRRVPHQYYQGAAREGRL